MHDYRFFEMDPASFPLFTSVNAAGLFSGEFYAFRVRIYITLTELINKLHSPEVLDSMLEHSANQHAGMHDVTQEHFRVRCTDANCTDANLKLP